MKDVDTLCIYRNNKLLFNFDHTGFVACQSTLEEILGKPFHVQHGDSINIDYKFPIGLEQRSLDRLTEWLQHCKYIKITDPVLAGLFQLIQEKLYKPVPPKNLFFRTYGKVKSWYFRTYGNVFGLLLDVIIYSVLAVGFSYVGFLMLGGK